MIKVAPKIIFLFDDKDGFATAIATALYPNTINTSQRLEESFELSLARFGVEDHKAKGSINNFVDSAGNYQVSVLLLEKYEPPILVCAVSEVLTQIIGEGASDLPTLIVPLIGASKLKWENKIFSANDGKVSVYGLQIGPDTDITQAIASRTHKPQSLPQIHYEPLACLLQLARVLKFPTSILIGQRNQSISDKAAEELEILYEIGELLAKTTSLCFLREKSLWNPPNMLKNSKEPWRALYG